MFLRKSNLLLLFILLQADVFWAQNPGTTIPFIEVTVTDTVRIKPDAIFYDVSISPADPSVPIYTDDQSDAATRMREAMEASMQKAETALLEILVADQITYNISVPAIGSNTNRKTYQIQFNAWEKVELFLKKTENYRELRLSLHHLSSGKEMDMEKAALKKTFKTAQQKAEAIAQFSGVKLGKVVQIKEGVPLEMALDENAAVQYDYSGLPTETPNEKPQITVSKTLTVRFAID